jgi:hypothetical protein
MKQKKNVTLTNCNVCEIAWYIIHGVSMLAYHVYKSATKKGTISGFHGDFGILLPYTIQVEANMMSIVSNIADRMPNETREIGKKQMDNLKMLPQLTIGSTFGWQKICKLV